MGDVKGKGKRKVLRSFNAYRTKFWRLQSDVIRLSLIKALVAVCSQELNESEGSDKKYLTRRGEVVWL